MTTNQEGAIAEAAIVQAAVKLGIGVYKPVHEGLRCDLVFEVEDDLRRLQCSGQYAGVRSSSYAATHAAADDAE